MQLVPARCPRVGLDGSRQHEGLFLGQPAGQLERFVPDCNLADDGLNLACPVPHDEECDLARDPLVAKPSPNRRLLSRIPRNILDIRDRHEASLYQGHGRRKTRLRRRCRLRRIRRLWTVRAIGSCVSRPVSSCWQEPLAHGANPTRPPTSSISTKPSRSAETRRASSREISMETASLIWSRPTSA